MTTTRRQTSEIPQQVISYLWAHHILTVGTSSFTGMPHAATIAYAADATGIYFSMRPDELTMLNIEANRWASFTIDDYTPEFRKLRELRGVGRCAPVVDADTRARVQRLFRDKLPTLPAVALANLYHIRPLELHFVDFEYTDDVAVPNETSIVYRADEPALTPDPAEQPTQLGHRTFEPGQVVLRQGERSERFYIIVSGGVEVRREGHGQDVIVTRLGPGQLFGEVGAVADSPQSATYTAIDRTTVMSVERTAFQDLMAQSSAADLGQRVRRTMESLDRDSAP